MWVKTATIIPDVGKRRAVCRLQTLQICRRTGVAPGLARDSRLLTVTWDDRRLLCQLRREGILVANAHPTTFGALEVVQWSHRLARDLHCPVLSANWKIHGIRLKDVGADVAVGRQAGRAHQSD